MAKEAFEQHTDLNQVAVGTGPFKLVEYVPDSHLKFERHAGYWKKGMPYLDGLNVRIVKDESARLAAARAGAADITYVTAVNAPAVKADRNLSLVEGDNVFYGMTLAQFIPNTSKAPFSDLRVRQAMNLAIDRKEMVDTVVFGSGVVAGPIPPGMGPCAISPTIAWTSSGRRRCCARPATRTASRPPRRCRRSTRWTWRTAR